VLTNENVILERWGSNIDKLFNSNIEIIWDDFMFDNQNEISEISENLSPFNRVNFDFSDRKKLIMSNLTYTYCRNNGLDILFELKYHLNLCTSPFDYSIIDPLWFKSRKDSNVLILWMFRYFLLQPGILHLFNDFEKFIDKLWANVMVLKEDFTNSERDNRYHNKCCNGFC
jgi:hypothetical protein